jgi:hypothetical protein
MGRLGRNDAHPTRKLSEIDDSAPNRRAASAWPNSCTSVKPATASTRRSAKAGSRELRAARRSSPNRKPGAIDTGNPRIRSAG